MGLTKISGGVIQSDNFSVGVITATSLQIGSATTIHTTGIDLGSGNVTSHNINSTGIITALLLVLLMVQLHLSVVMYQLVEY